MEQKLPQGEHAIDYVAGTTSYAPQMEVMLLSAHQALDIGQNRLEIRKGLSLRDPER